MTTSDAWTATTTGAGPGRVPLRLNLAEAGLGRGPFDGIWWPQGRDLDTEAAELVDEFPARHGHIERLEYSAPHWDLAGREIDATHATIRAEAARRDDAHLIVLTMSSGHTVRLLVLPPGMPETEARLIMDRDASDQSLADDGPTFPGAGPADASASAGEERWVDYGDTFWDPDSLPPSERGARSRLD